MTWNYIYTPLVWPSVLTVFLMLALALFSERRRSMPGVMPFIITTLFGAAWAAGSVMEYTAVDMATKIFWIKFETAMQLPVATAMTCFILEYAWPGRWLTRRNLALLSVAPFLVLGLIFTDHLYHGVWRDFILNGNVSPQLNPGGWAAVSYSFGLAILNLAVLVWLFLHSPQHRWPVAIMIAGHLGVRALYLLDKTQLFHPEIPLDMLGLAVADLMYAVALFSFRLFDPISLARNMAIEQLRDGMLVVDPTGRITSLNPAAERIFDATARQIRGKWIDDLLPGRLNELYADPDAEMEISLPSAVGQRDYSLTSSQLKDWRGQEVGRLLLLHDVTRRKLAEAALDESREIQRLIFEKSFDGISIYEKLPEADRRILVDCNERYCQMAGRSKQELLAIEDTRLIQRIENSHEEADRGTGMAEHVFSGVFSWIRPDGQENVIEYNAASIQAGNRAFTIGIDRDITERRQTQMQILEQERALAMLHEREQLARELHDSTSQVLGFASLKLEAALQQIANGQPDRAGLQLEQLENAILAAHADLREYILNLRATPNGEKPFFSALQQYLDGYCQNYSIQVDVSIGPGIDESLFGSDGDQLQLFRILQEALSNARKHAHTQCVQICFEKVADQLCLRIQDSGKGFDLQQAAALSTAHFGLQTMRERAEQLGGVLRVQSKPEMGTCVTLEVPIKEGGAGARIDRR